jgi:hypothetical protein
LHKDIANDFSKATGLRNATTLANRAPAHLLQNRSFMQLIKRHGGKAYGPNQ